MEEAVVAAGLPRECARSVDAFCRVSAECASNTFFTSVAIAVEADEPGNIAVDADEEEEEDEVAADGAEVGECAICYKEYVVGGATSLKLPCGHEYHRKCLNIWARVNASCPYCRGPVPVLEDDCIWDDHDEEEDAGDGGVSDDYGDAEEEDGDTSGDEDYQIQNSASLLTRIQRTLFDLW